jgi:hypothetical protein
MIVHTTPCCVREHTRPLSTAAPNGSTKKTIRPAAATQAAMVADVSGREDDLRLSVAPCCDFLLAAAAARPFCLR